MADRYFAPAPLAPGPYRLTGSEAHHLAGVLRAKPGDRVTLFDGSGAEFPAAVVAADKRAVELELDEPHRPDRELSFHLEVAAPLPKGDRGDFLIEKLTELGVTRFVPLKTRRSVVHVKDDRAGRLERAVIEACKQCGRNVFMEVAPTADWLTYCREAPAGRRRIVAHFTTLVRESNPRPAGDVVVAVGPEGGWTDEEVDAARRVGWEVVELGARVLRSETAALALAAWATIPG